MRNLDLLLTMKELERELEEKNDRSLVIVAAAGIEALLERLLAENVIVGQDPASLFGDRAPMGTFSSKIAMAHALGLISNDEKAELNRIRRIRNAMAHQLGISFTTDSIRDQCLNLTLGERLYAPAVIPFTDLGGGTKGVPTELGHPDIVWPTLETRLPGAQDPRARFVATARALIRSLGAREISAGGPAVSPDEFAHPEVPMETVLGAAEETLQRMDEVETERLGFAAEPEGSDTSIVSDEMKNKLKMLLIVGRYANEAIRKSRVTSDEK